MNLEWAEFLFLGLGCVKSKEGIHSLVGGCVFLCHCCGVCVLELVRMYAYVYYSGIVLNVSWC